MASAASFKKDSKGEIIHVGFKLNTNNEKLKTLFPGIKFIEQPIVAVMYQKHQDEMRMWYNKRAGKKLKAYVRGYFYKQNTAIVLHLTIESGVYWVTIMNKANYKPINVKQKVSAGALGAEVHVDKFELDADAYYFTNSSS